MPVEIGTPAPDFSLPTPSGEMMGLEDLKGQKSLIVFIPFPFTGLCESELCAIRDRLADLNDLDGEVVAISCDTRFANGKWSELNGFGFPVLSDFWPHGEVARAYGVFDEERGCAVRTSFVLDADGVVRDVIASGSLGTAREFELYVEALWRI